ncbi:protein of unknown function (plasmid) [Caballeronia sp. S22]
MQPSRLKPLRRGVCGGAQDVKGDAEQLLPRMRRVSVAAKARVTLVRLIGRAPCAFRNPDTTVPKPR